VDGLVSRNYLTSTVGYKFSRLDAGRSLPKCIQKELHFPLDLDDPAHLDALLRVYERFPEIGGRSTP
jgi:hypothetical protein